MHPMISNDILGQRLRGSALRAVGKCWDGTHFGLIGLTHSEFYVLFFDLVKRWVKQD